MGLTRPARRPARTTRREPDGRDDPAGRPDNRHIDHDDIRDVDSFVDTEPAGAGEAAGAHGSVQPGSRRSAQRPPAAPPPLLEAKRAPVVSRTVCLAAVAVIAFTLHRLWPGQARLMWEAGWACVGVVVVHAALGWRRNARRRSGTYAVNQLRATSGIAVTPVRLNRWSHWWVGTPTRLRLTYPRQLAMRNNGDGVGAEVVAAARTAWPERTWKLLGHQVRAARLTVAAVPAPPERESSALDLSKARVRDIVAKLFGVDSTLSGVQTDTDTVVGFTVDYSMEVAARVSADAVAERVVRIVSAVLPGRWRAHWRIVDDRVVFERRPKMPTMLARPVLECAPGSSNYYLLPQSVDEDGNIQYWDVSGIRAHFLKVGRTRTGKALEISTRIPTPSGWSRLGDLRVGDEVFDETGCPTVVLGVFDQPAGRECFEVVFSDGARIVADAEHQWWTETRSAGVSPRTAAALGPGRGRAETLPPAAGSRLREVAAASEPGQATTLDGAAAVINDQPPTYRLRSVARAVGAAGRWPSPAAFRYGEQTVVQEQLQRHYPAREADQGLIRRATVGQSPSLPSRSAGLRSRADGYPASDLTAREPADRLTVPRWQASRPLRALDSEATRRMSQVVVRVRTKRPGRAAQPGAVHPRQQLMPALAHAGERVGADQRRSANRGAVRTTAEIAATLLTADGQVNHSVPVAGPLRLPRAELPVAPYTLGAWLGAGSSWPGVVSSADPEVAAHIEQDGYETSRHAGSPDAGEGCPGYDVRGIRGPLDSLGLLGTPTGQGDARRIPPGLSPGLHRAAQVAAGGSARHRWHGQPRGRDAVQHGQRPAGPGRPRAGLLPRLPRHVTRGPRQTVRPRPRPGVDGGLHHS